MMPRILSHLVGGRLAGVGLGCVKSSRTQEWTAVGVDKLVQALQYTNSSLTAAISNGDRIAQDADHQRRQVCPLRGARRAVRQLPRHLHAQFCVPLLTEVHRPGSPRRASKNCASTLASSLTGIPKMTPHAQRTRPPSWPSRSPPTGTTCCVSRVG